VAEEVGLDFFGFGEHHTRSMPLASPTSPVNAAAASTQRIGLGTTVTVLSTDEPIRVFEQLAAAAAIAPGRIDVVAGRGRLRGPGAQLWSGTRRQASADAFRRASAAVIAETLNWSPSSPWMSPSTLQHHASAPVTPAQ